MSYATAQDFITEFGLTEATQLLADEEQLLTADLLKAAVAGSFPGGTPAADQAAGNAAKLRLERKLTSSTSVMDGYLRAVMALPLPAGHASAGVLMECCLALTRCALADDTDNATERMDDCCKTWRTWLRDVSSGKVLLVAADGTAAPRKCRVFSGPVVSQFDWQGFGRGAP
jgi:phage gp36-like protein